MPIERIELARCFAYTTGAAQPPVPMPVPADRHSFAFRTLLLALLALAIWPLWAVDVLPLPDYPQHLRVATILHDWQVMPMYRQVFERLPFPTPYSAFPWLVHVLARFHDVEWAGRVVLSAALIGLVLAARALVAVAGHSRWLLLAVMPWLLNADFFQGDVNLLMALPIALAVLAAHLHLLRASSPWRSLAVAVLLMALAVTHWIWALVVLLLPVLAAWQGWRVGIRQALTWPLREIALTVPSIGLLVPWARATLRTMPRGLRLEPAMPLDSLRHLPDRMFDVFAPHGGGLEGVTDLVLHRPGEVATCLWAVGITLWLLATVRQRRELAVAPPSSGVDGSAYLSQAFVLVLTAYFLLPSNIFLPFPVDAPGARLVDLMALLGVLALPLQPLQAPKTARLRTWLGTATLLVAAVIMPLATLEGFLLSRAELGPIREAYGKIPAGASVATLRTRTASRWLRKPALSEVGQWFDVMVGGYVPNALDDEWLRPVRARPAWQRPIPPDDPEAFRWHEHGRWFDFFAVYATPGQPPAAFDTFLRTLPKLYQHGPWSVYQNLDVTPWVPAVPLTPAQLRTAARLAECGVAAKGFTPTQPVRKRAEAGVAADAGREEMLRAWLGCSPTAAEPSSATGRQGLDVLHFAAGVTPTAATVVPPASLVPGGRVDR